MPVSELKLPDLFVGRYFEVPHYQREFAWTMAHCRDLIQDIDAIDIKQSAGRFIGYITGHPIGTAPRQTAAGQELTKINIVDGQQRLTALTLIIACLASNFRSLGESTVARGLEEAFVMTDMAETSPMPRLLIQELPKELTQDPRFNISMRDYFRHLI
ncbi:MAG: DUF262 domain-containing protein, partial [Roseiarcus sp.]